MYNSDITNTKLWWLFLYEYLRSFNHTKQFYSVLDYYSCTDVIQEKKLGRLLNQLNVIIQFYDIF